MLKTLVSGALYNILNIVVQIFLGLLVFKEMLQHFGEADFGLWSLLFAIFAHIKLFEIGMGSLISKLVPVLNADHRNTGYFSTVFLTFIGVSVFFLVALIVLTVLPIQYGLAFESTGSIKSVMLLLGLNFIFVFQTGAFHAYLTGNFKVGRLNGVRLVINVVRSLLIIVLLNHGYSVLATAVVFAAMAGIELGILIVISAYCGLFRQISLSDYSRESLEYVIQRGSRLLFLSINGYSRSNAAIIYCGLIFGPVLLVPLRVSGRLMEIYVEISTALNYLLTPYFSSLSSTVKDTNSVNDKFLVSLTCASVLSVSIYMNILILGEWFLQFWLTDVPQYTAEILMIVATGFCIANMQGPCTSMLISRDHEKVLMKICITELAVLLTSLFILIDFYGVIGAAYAVLLSLIISRTLVQPYLVCKTLNLSIVRYAGFILIPAGIVAALITLLHTANAHIHLNHNLFSVISFVGMQGVIVLAVSFTFYMKRKNDKRLNHLRL